MMEGYSQFLFLLGQAAVGFPLVFWVLELHHSVTEVGEAVSQIGFGLS